MSERSTLLALSNSSERTSVADYNSTSISEDDQQNCEPHQETMESTGHQTVSKWVSDSGMCSINIICFFLVKDSGVCMNFPGEGLKINEKVSFHAKNI